MLTQTNETTSFSAVKTCNKHSIRLKNFLVKLCASCHSFPFTFISWCSNKYLMKKRIVRHTLSILLSLLSVDANYRLMKKVLWADVSNSKKIVLNFTHFKIQWNSVVTNSVITYNFTTQNNLVITTPGCNEQIWSVPSCLL